MPTLLPNDLLDSKGQPGAHFQLQAANGTDGGTATGPAWTTRPFNTTLRNKLGITNSSGQFTIATTGLYFIEGQFTAYKTNRSLGRIYNITTSTELIKGMNGFTAAADAVQTTTTVSGWVYLTAGTVIAVQHYISTTSTTNGYGNGATTGTPEVYADVKIWYCSSKDE